MKMQKRLKSKVVWVTTIVNIIAILSIWGVIGEIEADTIEKIAVTLGHMLVQLGILNNPTDSENF